MTKGFSTRIIPINKDNMLFRNVDAFYLKSKNSSDGKGIFSEQPHVGPNTESETVQSSERI